MCLIDVIFGCGKVRALNQRIEDLKDFHSIIYKEKEKLVSSKESEIRTLIEYKTMTLARIEELKAMVGHLNNEISEREAILERAKNV